jgi:hypothetical protein
MKPVICPYCSNAALLVTGVAIYPHRPDLFDRKFYQCAPCDAYVGVHINTDKPLGRLANAELRKAKVAAHAVFDPTWKGKTPKGKARKAAYFEMADRLGIRGQVHIGEMDVEQCMRVVELYATPTTRPQ